MADRLSDVVAQIQNVRQLEAVVTAMRGIAASRAQKARALLAGVDAYGEVVSRAMGQALSLMVSEEPARQSSGQGKLGLVLFCAEQGFAGAFSERVLQAASPDVARGTIFIVGTRGATIAREHGIEPAWSGPMAGHADAVPYLANRLTNELYSYLASGTMTVIDVIYARSFGAAGAQPERHSLLPIDFERFGRPEDEPPLISLDPGTLLQRLAPEYVYSQLCRAALHAFAAENEARMIAMLAARTNIETTLGTLSQRERQLRQEEITTEVIELAAAAEALMGS